MRLRLKRISESILCTMGVLVNEGTGLPICLTLELPNKGNQKDISCIPKGVYSCGFYSSPKYLGVYQVKNVPNRSAILIHIGNTVEDIEGCILVGSEFGTLGGNPAVLSSQIALSKLKKVVVDRDFDLIIE